MTTPDFAEQAPYAVRFDWGGQGVEHVGNRCPVTVIVDVLSFSTCVDVACSRGAVVLPYRHKDESAAAFAEANGAMLAGSRGHAGFSLSPASLTGIEAGTRLVLPSPNGSTLTGLCTSSVVITACLRNADAVAAAVAKTDGPVAVIAAGERWADGSLRPCVEDLVGAGAVIHALSGRKSPEAVAAEAAFVSARGRIEAVLGACASGVELESRGFGADVAIAAAVGQSRCVPLLVGGAYVRADAGRISGAGG